MSSSGAETVVAPADSKALASKRDACIRLPAALLATVLSLLSHADRFTSAACVSRSWRDASRSPLVWISNPLPLQVTWIAVLRQLAATKWARPRALRLAFRDALSGRWKEAVNVLADLRALSRSLEFLSLNYVLFEEHQGLFGRWFPALRTLELHVNGSAVVGAAFVQQLGEIASLTSLTVVSRSNQPEAKKAFAALKALPLLTRLDAPVLVDNDALAAFAEARMSLQLLSTGGAVTDGCTALQRFTRLRELKCSCVRWRCLPRLPPSLTRLSLRSTAADQGFDSFAPLADCPRLEHLTLQLCDSLEPLRSVAAKLTALRTLRLFAPTPLGIDVPALLPSLTALELDTDLGSFALPHLEALLRGLPRLQRVLLRHLDALSGSAAVELVAACCKDIQEIEYKTLSTVVHADVYLRPLRPLAAERSLRVVRASVGVSDEERAWWMQLCKERPGLVFDCEPAVQPS